MAKAVNASKLILILTDSLAKHYKVAQRRISLT